MDVTMPIGLRACLIVGALLVLFYIISSSIKAKMSIRYVILWTLWSLVILIFGIWPNIAGALSSWMGIKTASNFVFLVMIALLFLLNYYIFQRLSHFDSVTRKMNYELAELKKELSELKDQKDRT